jgi:Zn ribbon nucleic-acid-binding protein
VPFLCPACSRHGTLSIKRRIELPPDSRSDEIALQIVECSDCGFAGIAVYEESRRGPLGTETFHHTGYRLTRNDLRALRKAIRSCPDPTNSRCPCPAHQRLSQTDASGRWNALHDLDTTDSFPIEK